jgi:hypothetical protein
MEAPEEDGGSQAAGWRGDQEEKGEILHERRPKPNHPLSAGYPGTPDGGGVISPQD